MAEVAALLAPARRGERPQWPSGAGRQTRAELAHWRVAIEALADLDAIASPDAWTAMEEYLRRGARERLAGMVSGLIGEAWSLERLAAAGADDPRVRRGILRLRARYLQAETVLDFYGDAINTRTNPAVAALLRGYDTLASDSMSASLGPLGLEAPPALVYIDKGLGAAILRAGVRLWDDAHPSPAAAIKLTRHNLSFPTALLHETGHQVGHLTGWNAELADALHGALAPRSREVADVWRSWASEIAADVHAFAQAGWAPVVALANVVDGPSSAVYRLRPGDPHPFPLIRVAFNIACCRSWYGAGPWDEVAAAWAARHPVTRAGRDVAAITRVSLAAMGELVDAATRRPMATLGGRALAGLLDPARVSPAALDALHRRAGASLLTSSYLRRREPLRILALLATRGVVDPVNVATHRADLRAWVAALGDDTAPHPSTARPPTSR